MPGALTSRTKTKDLDGVNTEAMLLKSPSKAENPSIRGADGNRENTPRSTHRRLNKLIFEAKAPEVSQTAENANALPDEIKSLIGSSAVEETAAKKMHMSALNLFPLQNGTPRRFGKRVNIKKPTYEELLNLKDPPNMMKNSKSQSNLTRTYDNIRSASQQFEPFSVYRAKREINKSIIAATAKAEKRDMEETEDQDDFADYILVGKNRVYAHGVKAGSSNTFNQSRSQFLMNVQKAQ